LRTHSKRSGRTALLVVCSAALALTACSSTSSPSSGGGYSSGPTRFSAHFTSTPKAASTAQLAEVKAEYTGASSAAVFYVTPSAGDIFANGAAVPGPTTEAVLAIRFTAASGVSALIADIKKSLPSATPATVDGYSGVRVLSLASKSPLAKDSKITDHASYLGALLLGSGQTLFEVEAVTTTAPAASAFMASFKPLG
jgi:hypothetical protein